MVGVFLDAVGGLQRNSWYLCKYDVQMAVKHLESG